jgi:hypothetical protein
MGRAHPRAFVLHVLLTGARPVEDGRCLACGRPEPEAGCHVVEIGDAWDGVPVLTVFCRPEIERLHAEPRAAG